MVNTDLNDILIHLPEILKQLIFKFFIWHISWLFKTLCKKWNVWVVFLIMEIEDNLGITISQIIAHFFKLVHSVFNFRIFNYSNYDKFLLYMLSRFPFLYQNS
jgi:hypothetical protein